MACLLDGLGIWGWLLCKAMRGAPALEAPSKEIAVFLRSLRGAAIWIYELPGLARNIPSLMEARQ